MERVLNIAHRGARSLAPENTLEAARAGLKTGADLWETDVAVTKDGVLILMHDDSLARTTDVARIFPDRAHNPFSTFTLEEVRRLDAGSWFIAKDPFGQIAAGAVPAAQQNRFPGLLVPTLREALSFTRDADWLINIELKRLPAGMEDFPVHLKVLDLIEELKLGGRHIILSSGRHDWLREIQERRRDIPVQALMGLMPDDEMDFGDKSFKTYNIRVTRTSAAEVRRLTAEGHEVNLYVVNETEDMQSFAEAGAAGLITDFPQRLKYLMEPPR